MEEPPLPYKLYQNIGSYMADINSEQLTALTQAAQRGRKTAQHLLKGALSSITPHLKPVSLDLKDTACVDWSPNGRFVLVKYETKTKKSTALYDVNTSPVKNCYPRQVNATKYYKNCISNDGTVVVNEFKNHLQFLVGNPDKQTSTTIRVSKETAHPRIVLSNNGMKLFLYNPWEFYVYHISPKYRSVHGPEQINFFPTPSHETLIPSANGFSYMYNSYIHGRYSWNWHKTLSKDCLDLNLANVDQVLTTNSKFIVHSKSQSHHSVSFIDTSDAQEKTFTIENELNLIEAIAKNAITMEVKNQEGRRQVYIVELSQGDEINITPYIKVEDHAKFRGSTVIVGKNIYRMVPSPAVYLAAHKAVKSCETPADEITDTTNSLPNNEPHTSLDESIFGNLFDLPENPADKNRAAAMQCLDCG